MRKLFLEISLLFVITAAMIFFLEKKYSSYKTKADLMMEDFISHASDAELLLVGNSHMLTVYRETKSLRSGKVAMLGLEGIDIFQLRNLVCRYAPQMKKLKLILINADEYCLGTNLKVLNFLYVDRMLYRYTDTLYEETVSARLAARSNFLRSNRDLSFLFTNRSAAAQENSVPVTGNPLSPVRCSERAVELTQKRFQKKLYAENIRLLGELLDGGLSTGAKVVVASLPLSPCYNEYKLTANTFEGSQLIGKIASSKGIHYYNLTHSPEMDEAQFRDADHLNVIGVMNFISVMDSLLKRDAQSTDFSSLLTGTGSD